MFLETDIPFVLNVQHKDEIERKLKRMILDIVGLDIFDIIYENWKEVFCYCVFKEGTLIKDYAVLVDFRRVRWLT